MGHVRGWGREDFASAMDAMRSIAADPRLASGMPVLMDIRELDYLATPPEVASFAAVETRSPLYAGRRVALVARRGAQFGIAKAFAHKATASGARVKVFAEPQLALAWLTEMR